MWRSREILLEESKGNKGNVKKGDKKRKENVQREKAEIHSMNENTRRERGREKREGGSELIKGLCCRDKAEQHPG